MHPCSVQTNNPLDNWSNLVRNAGSIRHVFTSWWREPKRSCSFSETSVVEEDHFNLPVKTEGTGNTDGVETCSVQAAPQSPIDTVCYEAESPDEAALVYAAKAYGFTLLARAPDSVTVRLPSGQDLVFEVLDTLNFDSHRKRMSILVRHPVTKECVLYTKGADYSIMELLGTPYAGMQRNDMCTYPSN